MKSNNLLIILAVVLCVMLSTCGGIVGYKLGKSGCNETVLSDTVTIVKHDSVMVKANIYSKPRKTIHYKGNVYRKAIDTIHCDTVRIIARELVALADTCFYSDTLRNDTSYSIVVNDTIVGNRLGLGVEFKNLRPHVNTVVTVTKYKKQWQLYLIAQVPVNTGRVGVIPTAMFTTPFGLVAGYGYDAVNNLHVPSVGWSIRFGAK